MRILHVVPYLPKASGVTTFVVEVSDALQTRGHAQSIAVYDNIAFDGAESKCGVPRIPLDVAISSIRAKQFNIVHIHGIWPPFMHKVVNAAIRSNTHIVWSIHGMLSAWAMRYKMWKKFPVWWLWQKRDLSKAILLHSTSQNESRDIMRCGVNRPVIEIPLGTFLRAPVKWEWRGNVALFVGRLNPIKAIDNLIRAWAIAKVGWSLRIVGSGDVGYQRELEALVVKLGLEATVSFVGPKYGEELDEEYKKAKMLILPSHTENFGGVVIDALSWGVPVVASTNTPWQILEAKMCGRWSPNSPKELGETVRDLVSLGDATLCEMGARGRNLVEDTYTWAAIVDKLEAAYMEVL